MITLRMVAIAVAILVAIPVATVLADDLIPPIVVPGGDVVNFGLEEAATVTDIVLADPPRKFVRAVNEFRHEQLVEGHTVFITIDIPLVENVTNFTFDIVGNVECSTHINGSGEFVDGIVPVPRRIDEFHEECTVAGQTFVTPDPFIDSDRSGTVSSLQMTGNFIPFTAPNGQSGDAVEYVYTFTERDWLGSVVDTRTLYAYSVPVLDPWIHTDGRPKSWYCPLPEDRLREMGIETFRVYHESELPREFLA